MTMTIPPCPFRHQEVACLHPAVNLPEGKPLIPARHCATCTRFADAVDPRPIPSELPPAPPTLARKAWNFAAALAAHIGDGMRKRDRAEIESLFTICKACPLFNGKTCTHKQCGCAANREQKFFNKLAWRSEHCPVGKW